MKKQLAINIIYGLLILLFGYTAISKLADFDSFKATLAYSPLINKHNETVAWFLPFMELAIVILLFVPVTRLTGMCASLVLLLLLTFYLIYFLILTPGSLPCSCGGVISQMTWKQHIIFNCVFIFLSLTGIILETHSKILLQQTGGKQKT